MSTDVAEPVSRSRHVLIAEDDDELRETLANGLTLEGYVAIEARDVVELARVFERMVAGECRKPDAFLLDVRMPFCSGLEVLAMLRRANVRVPIVLMSGLWDADLKREALRAGAHAVLETPFPLSELRVALAAP